MSIVSWFSDLLDKLQHKHVQWIVNDKAQLGVKIGEKFFFMENGKSVASSGKQWRYLLKNEFGKCVAPWGSLEIKKYGSTSHAAGRSVSLPANYVGYMGESVKLWHPLPKK